MEPTDRTELSSEQEMLLGQAISKAWPTQNRSEREVAAYALSICSSSDPRINSRRSLRRWTSYAAVTTLGIVAVLAWSNNRTATPAESSAPKTYRTASGRRASVTLADGSTAILAPATSLRVTDRFVELSGEAVFTVNQKAGSPFVIKTGNTLTRVLGTRFGVRKYTTDPSLRVVVAEGRVAASSAVLSAGDLVQVTDTSIHVSHNANVSNILAWASPNQPRLFVQNESVPVVLAHLERWYNVKFVGMDEDLKRDMLSTTIEDPQLTDATLELLGAALGRRLEKRGQTIYISIP